jgi:putative hydrolase of the HAD superfamily
LRSNRAIVFDLDDTLYPYRAFVRSGFRAVACRLAAERGIKATAVLRVLRRAMAAGARGQELQALFARFDLPVSMMASLVDVIREHTPALRLPRESAEVLRTLRPRWRVGVLTNGEPRIQQRKIAALGIADLVDAVMVATECGDGSGKPAPAAFHTALDRLKVTPASTVFVGDDVRIDIEGAAAVGMKTIHVMSYFGRDERCAAPGCRIHVNRLALVPAIAERLVPVRIHAHVA